MMQDSLRKEVTALAIWIAVALALVVTHFITDVRTPLLLAMAVFWPVAYNAYQLLQKFTFKSKGVERSPPLPAYLEVYQWLGVGLFFHLLDPDIGNAEYQVGESLELMLQRNLLKIVNLYALLAIVVHFPWFMKSRAHQKKRFRDGLLGQKGTITKWKGKSGKARVKFADTHFGKGNVWKAVSADGEPISPGTVVKVVDVDKKVKTVTVQATDEELETKEEKAEQAPARRQSRNWLIAAFSLSGLWLLSNMLELGLHSIMVPYILSAFLCAGLTRAERRSGGTLSPHVQVIYWFLGGSVLWLLLGADDLLLNWAYKDLQE